MLTCFSDSWQQSHWAGGFPLVCFYTLFGLKRFFKQKINKEWIYNKNQWWNWYQNFFISVWPNTCGECNYPKPNFWALLHQLFCRWNKMPRTDWVIFFFFVLVLGRKNNRQCMTSSCALLGMNHPPKKWSHSNASIFLTLSLLAVDPDLNPNRTLLQRGSVVTGATAI